MSEKTQIVSKDWYCKVYEKVVIALKPSVKWLNVLVNKKKF